MVRSSVCKGLKDKPTRHEADRLGLTTECAPEYQSRVGAFAHQAEKVEKGGMLGAFNSREKSPLICSLNMI